MASIGIDIVSTRRIKNLLSHSKGTFKESHFTPEEIAYCACKAKPYLHFAGRFAAKEAVAKALKLSWNDGYRWTDISILSAPGGLPTVELSGKAKSVAVELGVTDIEISISHCEEYAVAAAIVP